MGLMRLLIWGLLLYVGYRVVKALFKPKEKSASTVQHDGEETVQDPICGMFLARTDAVVGTLEGKRHYFCSMACLDKFREQLDHNESTNKP